MNEQTESTEVVKAPPPAPPSEVATAFAFLQREAKALVESGLLPEPLRNVGAAMQVMAMAKETGLPAFMLAQSLHAVKGKIGLSASYMIALANQHPKIEQNLLWEVTGAWPQIEVTCIGRLRGDPEGKHRTVTLAMSDAKEMGWTSNEKYRSRASATHMLKFRTATWWVRENVPEVLFGLHTDDEIRDMVVIESTPATRTTLPAIAAPVPDLSDIAAQRRDAEPAKPEPVKAEPIEEEANREPSPIEQLQIRAEEANMSFAAYLGSKGWTRPPEALTEADAARLIGGGK